MTARCGVCPQPAVARSYFRTGDPLDPADIAWCMHHYGKHGSAAQAAPNFIVTVLLDEDGQPYTADSEDA